MAVAIDVRRKGAVSPLSLPLQPVSLLLDPGAMRGPAAAAVQVLLGELVLLAAISTSQRGLKWTQYCHCRHFDNVLLFSFLKSQSATDCCYIFTECHFV